MARLPSEMYLMQQSGGTVRLFEDCTERQIVTFDPADGIAVANALEAIGSSELSDEDKAFACFWAGYFHAYAPRDPEVPREIYACEQDGQMLVTDAGTEVARFDPRDGNATAIAQKAIYDCGLAEDEKARAHFWSGFHYGQASGNLS
jgi:hypothetical protein